MSGSPLDPAHLLAAAQAQTGLSDWGDTSLPARFGLAVDHLNGLAMGEDGNRRAAEVCLWLLTSRLRFFDDRQHFPVGDEVIERPLFATGEPRSGTTLLHALMSVDPDARALRFWEVMNPSPPPGTVSGIDPRIARADADWREINARLPGWLRSHPYNDMLGNGLPECERTWAFDFRVMTPTAWWRVPMPMVSSGLPTDPAMQYRIHTMMLQQFQFARPKKYWVLKGFHAVRLKALFDAYPDANLVWIHRDPVQVAASRIQLSGDLVEGMSGRVDWKEQARVHLDATRASIAATLANPFLDDPRICHVRYSDFVRDPVGTIGYYYRHCGMTLSPAAEAAMHAYLRENRGDRHGKFRYSTALLTDIGEDIAALHREFAPFRARFGVEIENRV